MIVASGKHTFIYIAIEAMAQSKVRGFSQLENLVDLSTSFFVHVYQVVCGFPRWMNREHFKSTRPGPRSRLSDRSRSRSPRAPMLHFMLGFDPLKLIGRRRSRKIQGLDEARQNSMFWEAQGVKSIWGYLWTDFGDTWYCKVNLIFLGWCFLPIN